jgi:hypothetical protein
MWYYRRRLSVHPIESTVTFAGQRLKIAADGCVLSPVDEALDLKMKRAPHVFIFKAAPAPAAPVVETAPAVESAPAAPAVKADEGAAGEVEKVETSSVKDDNVEPKRTRKRRKVQG